MEVVDSVNVQNYINGIYGERCSYDMAQLIQHSHIIE